MRNLDQAVKIIYKTTRGGESTVFIFLLAANHSFCRDPLWVTCGSAEIPEAHGVHLSALTLERRPSRAAGTAERFATCFSSLRGNRTHLHACGNEEKTQVLFVFPINRDSECPD